MSRKNSSHIVGDMAGRVAKLLARRATALIGLLSGFIMLGGAACTDESTQVAEAMPKSVDLVGTAWQVEDIDAGGIVDRSNVTIEIPAAGNINGSAGCNRYFGTMTVAADGISISGLGSTRMACVPALNAQEQRFLTALQESVSFTADEQFLRLRDADGRERIRAVRMEPDQKVAKTEPAGTSDAAAIRFKCGDALVVSLEFTGPESISLTLPDGKRILQQERAASGARYVGESILFWNKGDEALLDIGGVQHNCTRVSH